MELCNVDKNMKKFFKIYVMLFSVLLLVNNSVIALEFKREADKAEWIKNFFKDKETRSSDYNNDKWTKEVLGLFEDFVTQNGIEHVEPIAVGRINDPEIAKFNTACPDKKPINFHKYCCYFDRMDESSYCEPEEKLDNPELANFTDQYRCSKDSNLKIYKFNVYNTPDNKETYVLYCDDFVLLRSSSGYVFDESMERSTWSIKAAYLQFNPKQCVYTNWVGSHSLYTQEKNFLTGIFKYKGKYYFYDINTRHFSGEKEESTHLRIYKESINGSSSNYGRLYYLKK